MGLDYIRAQTGKPWRKRWDGGLDRLKAPTLLDLTMSEAARVVTAQLDPAARVKAGDTLIVQSAGDGLVVSDGLRSIGRIRESHIRNDHGCRATAAAMRKASSSAIGLFGDTAEIVVK